MKYAWCNAVDASPALLEVSLGGAAQGFFSLHPGKGPGGAMTGPKGSESYALNRAPGNATDSTFVLQVTGANAAAAASDVTVGLQQNQKYLDSWDETNTLLKKPIVYTAEPNGADLIVQIVINW